MRRLRLPLLLRRRQRRRNRMQFSADQRAARNVEREFRRYLGTMPPNPSLYADVPPAGLRPGSGPPVSLYR